MSRILFDQGTPAPLRGLLIQHTIQTAYEQGWSSLQNGELLDRAEAEGFDILITTDRNLRHQQNLSARRVAILVLGSTSWPRIQLSVDKITQAIDQAMVGSYAEIEIDPGH